jgi:cell division protein FtsQ
VGAGLLAGAAFGIAHSPLLTVHHVEVAGAQHSRDRDVVAAAGLRHGTLMIDVQPGRVTTRLGALPWVATAKVSRRWPSTVAIRVTERAPVAIVPAGTGDAGVVDGTGRVLALGPAASIASAVTEAPLPRPLPVIHGLGPAGPAGTTLDGGRSAADALALVAALHRDLPASLAARVTEVTVGADGQLTATINPGITVRFGPGDRFDAKLLTLRTLTESADLTGATAIDVRVPDVPVLTRQGRSGTVSTVPRG